MPRPRKYIEHGAAMFVTSRTEEGLPFDFRTNPEIHQAFLAIMARAQTLYPVHIIAYILMVNHFHMLLVAENPENLPKFIGYVKQELAHIINRSNSRRKKTVWCEGYDSPLLLTIEDAIKYLNYIFQQPLKANLSRTLDEFTGASSWTLFKKNIKSLQFERIYRVNLEQGDQGKPKQTLQLNLSLQPLLDSLAPEMTEKELRERVIKQVQDDEVINKPKVVFPPASKEYQESYIPKTFGRRMVCICSDIELRKLFLSVYKKLCEAASKALKYWKQGVTKVRWPPGMFPPCNFTFSSALRGAVFRSRH